MDAHRLISLLHILASCAALVIGAWVLIAPKGGIRHWRMGRAYAISMLLVNATAFGIYRLYGGFGPFHVAAVISLLTLLAGMRPVLLRPRPRESAVTHMTFMYWSVVGLYAAFASELLVRVPDEPRAHFGLLVGLATGVIVLAGALLQRPLVRRWSEQLAPKGRFPRHARHALPTRGNLSVQLTKLKEAGYISVAKGFKDNYPQTVCAVTYHGIRAFEAYVAALKGYLGDA